MDDVKKIYNSLDESEKLVVDILTLIFVSFSNSEFLDFYSTHIVKAPAYKLKAVLSSLRKKGLLTGNEYYSIILNYELRLWLYPQLSKEQIYIEYANVIQLNYKGYSSFKIRYENLVDYTIQNLLFGYFYNNNMKFIAASDVICSNYAQYSSVIKDFIHDESYHEMLFSMSVNDFFTLINNYRKQCSFELAPIDLIDQLVEKALIEKYKEKSFINKANSFLANSYIQKGKIDRAIVINKNTEGSHATFVNSIINALQGEYLLSVNTFNQAIALYANEINQKQIIVEGYFLFYFVTSIIAIEKKDIALKIDLSKKIKLYEKIKDANKKSLIALLYFADNNHNSASKTLSLLYNVSNFHFAIDQFFYIIASFLIHNKLTTTEQEISITIVEKMLNNGYNLFAIELAWILSKELKKEEDKTYYKGISDSLNIKPMLSRITLKEEWEKTLEGLLNINSSKTVAIKDTDVEGSRIVYLVDFDRNIIQPTLQTRTKKGWSKGRNIALKKLKELDVPGMTEQDNKIANAVRIESSYYGSADYYMDMNRILPELVGHPYLFYYRNPDVVVELIKAQPELIIEKTAKNFTLSCNVDFADSTVILKKETNTRYNLIVLTKEQLLVVQSLKKGKLVVPTSANEMMMKTISHLSSFMTIHSDIVATETTIKQIDADSRIRVQLIPVSDSLKVECFVKPFNSIPPYSKPGKGAKTVYGILEDEKYQAIRDLKAEQLNLDKLTAALSNVLDIDFSEDDVFFDNPQDCLSLLEVLREKSDIAIVEWPEGEKYKVRRSVSFGQLSISVKGKGHWFEMEGELAIDESNVITIKQLLELNKLSKNRFIELSNGEFLALSEEFKKRLDELTLFSTIDKSGVKINKFAATSIENIAESAASFHSDKYWKSFMNKIEVADNKIFDVPSTLQAELRPYQDEGFKWMARLAEWEAGACLADDMGLGKTVQAIAILLHRAENGPALVISPVSVQPNWAAELERFAPSLSLNFLNNANREEVFDNLSSNDVLVTSYGILQSEEERLVKVKWNTVILDEAHAIKNTQTKTSKAAMNIDAAFKLILTGTPLQNHLGELWNLFNFINPGLLGSLAHFNENYVIPVEKYGNQQPKQHLKKLIAPFILRRTKAKVLDELPPKTEITKKIELSGEEMAFYEALRRQAIENLEQMDSPNGQQHLQALAEITRLRMACCHPSLVNKDLELPSSKLNAFLDIVDELIENKHRALVFSQFIGHLALVRKALDERKISYQYLDGSTPINDRATLVKSFQAGKGDVFLISLKAGGLGLNLTAADYVIHLDPWWNPAIEDQASDRAHRIGQNRPVTIYRLVAKGTIEEKILQLHATKRDMADSLLEGSDQSAKMNTQDLLDLLKER